MAAVGDEESTQCKLQLQSEKDLSYRIVERKATISNTSTFSFYAFTLLQKIPFVCNASVHTPVFDTFCKGEIEEMLEGKGDPKHKRTVQRQQPRCRLLPPMSVIAVLIG